MNAMIDAPGRINFDEPIDVTIKDHTNHAIPPESEPNVWHASLAKIVSLSYGSDVLGDAIVEAIYSDPDALPFSHTFNGPRNFQWDAYTNVLYCTVA